MSDIVISGMGMINPLGLNIKDYFDNIKKGKSCWYT